MELVSGCIVTALVMLVLGRLFLVHLGLLANVRLKGISPFVVYQDGQLSWLALAWSCATVYQLVSYVQTHHYEAWFAAVFAIESMVIATASVISIGGALTTAAGPRKDNTYAAGSAIVTVISAGLYALVHWVATH